MSNRVAPLTSTLSVLAFMAWLTLSSRSTREVERLAEIAAPVPTSQSTGQFAPACDPPVSWRLAGVDPRFGLSLDAVEAAVHEAVALWEDGVGRPLFVTNGQDGIPVRLVYDHRQARTDERVRAEDRVRHEDEILAIETADLSRAWEDHHDTITAHATAHAELVLAVEMHNRAVRDWNESGGAPQPVAEELMESGRRLRLLEERLALAARRLEAEEDALRVAEQELMDRVAARNAEIGRLERAFPPVSVESGAYLAGERPGSGAERGIREIRIFRFQDRADLVRVLAHELGHALGLGHIDERDALMHGRQDGTTQARGRNSLHQEDVRALEDVCRDAAPR